MGRRFKIKLKRLRNASEEIYYQSRQVHQISDGIFEIILRLAGISNMEDVCRMLRETAQQVQDEAASLNRFSDSTARIENIYNKAENDIIRNGEKGWRLFPTHELSGWEPPIVQVDKYWFGCIR